MRVEIVAGCRSKIDPSKRGWLRVTGFGLILFVVCCLVLSCRLRIGLIHFRMTDRSLKGERGVDIDKSKRLNNSNLFEKKLPFSNKFCSFFSR